MILDGSLGRAQLSKEAPTAIFVWSIHASSLKVRMVASRRVCNRHLLTGPQFISVKSPWFLIIMLISASLAVVRLSGRGTLGEFAA